MILNIITMVLSIIFPLILLKKDLKIENNESLKDFFIRNKYEIITFLSLFVGFAIRIVSIATFPKGLNPDETSAGYEAYSILNYGIDRNGNSFPVFLVSWGSGQNALYTYLLIPFIKILGLNQFSIRLPMAIISCLSLIMLYLTLKRITKKRVTTIVLAFFAICPWHIMKSRYGLESNIFPDLILYAFCSLLLFINSRKIKFIYISAILLGISAYSYGTSYFFLPMFTICVLIYLLKYRYIKIKQAIIAFFIVGTISIPIIVMLAINTFNLQQIQILNITIPKLYINRYESVCNIFSMEFLENIKSNFVGSILILLNQSDGFEWNALQGIGLIYLISIPFTVIGTLYIFKNNEEKRIKGFLSILKMWLVSALLLLFICIPNIVRINIIMIPLIIITTIGILISIKILKEKKYIKIILICVYTMYFIFFTIKYFTVNIGYPMYIDGLKEVIEYAEKIEDKKIYVEYCTKEPYIYFLFYTKYDTKDFVDTVEYFEDRSIREFENVKSFGKYNFYLPDNLELNEDIVYIVSKDNNLEIDYSQFETKYFEKYIVLKRKRKKVKIL